MKKLLLLILLPLVSFNFSGKKIIYIGDSVSFGYGLPDQAKRWPTVFSDMVGAIEVNRAITSTTLEAGLGRIAFDINNVDNYTTDYAAVFIAYSINDIENGGDTIHFKAAMDTAVNAIVAKGWTTDKIVIVSSYWFNSAQGKTDADKLNFVNAAKNYAVAKGCQFVDVYNRIANDPNRNDYLVDGFYHPNAAGDSIYAGLMYQNLVHQAVTEPTLIKSRKAIVQ